MSWTHEMENFKQNELAENNARAIPEKNECCNQARRRTNREPVEKAHEKRTHLSWNDKET